MSRENDKLNDLRKAGAKKTQRVQLVITPELFDKLKAISASTGASVNGIITKAIETFIEDL